MAMGFSGLSVSDPKRMDGEGEVTTYRRNDRLRTSDADMWDDRLERVFKDSRIAGGAIYFARTKAEAQHKCRTLKQDGKGVAYKCKVYLGKRKVISQKDPKITFTKLYNEGYDSVETHFTPNPEYAVYNADQAEILDREDF
eukprot:g17393.t1